MKNGDAKPSFAAYLEDRILMREGEKQIYGTQLHTNETTKKLELYPVENEESLDARRAIGGVGTNRGLFEAIRS